MAEFENELRRALALVRQARGVEAPTLGRLFAATPGIVPPDDDMPTLRAIPLEEWAAQPWPSEPERP